jgi:DNA-binding NtrC family response regulator
MEAASDVAATRTTVLLLGESGTGKEVLARWLHRKSPRAAGAWVAVNCAALPADLLESELFGHEKGSFTGAGERRIGRIEQADGGTLLLDEISELPLLLQAKLLRVLQEREVDRVGGTRPVPVDVRLIATSNRHLGQMVQAGQFRQDLYYRLDVFPLQLPPLRERREDLPELASVLLDQVAASLGRPAPLLDASALRALSAARLPGNVRELGNLLERALVRCHGPVIGAAALGPLEPREGWSQASLAAVAPGATFLTPLPSRQVSELPFSPQHAPSGSGAPPPRLVAVPPPSQQPGAGAEALLEAGSEAGQPLPGTFPAQLPLELAELERLAISEALRRTGGNRTRAAQLLGIGLRTLRSRLNDGRGEEIAP